MPDQTQQKPTGDQPDKKKSLLHSQRMWLLTVFTLLIVIAIGLYTIYYLYMGQFYVSTDDAYVHGNKIAVMSRVPGTATHIYVSATRLVHEGDPLVQLDDTDARMALDRAKQQLANTARQVAALFAIANQQKAKTRVNQAQLTLIKKNYKRYKYMLNQQAISQEQFDSKQMKLNVAKAKLAVVRGLLKATQAKIAGTTIATNPAVKLAAIKVRKDYLNWQRTKIKAPATGYIVQRNVRVGQYVQPNEKLMVIVPLKKIWVDANFKETTLAHVKVGQPVTLTSDLYGGNVTYHGTVEGVYGGTGAAFALLPPQNATGNWIKVVRRLPVRILLNGRELKKHPLYLGLSMHVTVDVHGEKGPLLAGRSGIKNHHKTTIFKDNLNKIDAVIDRIIASNSKSISENKPALQSTCAQRSND